MAIYRGPGGTGDSNRGESVEGPNSTIENLTGLIGPIRTPTYIEFNKTANHTPIAGQLTWNEQEGTLDVGLNSGSVVLQIGEETLYRVHNGSGVVIPNGTLVMATGTLGNSGRIVVAAYDGSAAPERIMGLATEEIGIGLEGYVTHFGKVRGIQTNGANYGETWADGDIIYASNTGGLTNVRPAAPDTKTIIAIVINAHSGNGTLFVRVTRSSALTNDDLVELGTLTNGDILVYNDSTNRFENVANTAIQPGDNVSELTNDAGYLITESDPVYTGSSWYTTTNNSSDWDTAYSWGDHATEGYLDAGDVGTTVLAYDSNLQSFVSTFTLPTVDGTANQVVATDGTGNLVFNTISGTGTVTSVDITAGTGISATGGPITTNGSITVTNTAPMTYPSTGMAVSTGSAWGTSKTTPTGDVVGTTDTQTLTNKTISMSGLLTQSAGADIASASTVDLTAATGNCPKVTGTTPIVAWTMNIGQQMKVIADGALPLTYHATTNNIEGGASYTCAAGDIINLVKGLDGVIRVRIDKQDGTPVVTPLAAVSVFGKLDYDSTCFIKTGAGTLSVKAGTTALANGVAVVFNADTAISMPTLTGGSDYSIWVNDDGSIQALADSYGTPATAPTTGAIKIGGFHYGLVAPGTTVAGGSFSTSGVTATGGSMAWTQGLVDKIAGINEYSLWDLCWRCAGEQYGMVYSDLANVWGAIYFCSTDADANGISAYNTNVASGTVLPKVPAAWGGNGTLTYTNCDSWAAMELTSAHGLRLPTYEEFVALAFGVTEGQSPAGAATIAATTRAAGYTSKVGIEQATGHQWWIGAPHNAVGGSGYAAAGRGQWYGAYGMPLFSGSRGNAAVSGSRAALFYTALSSSHWNCSVRAVGDHLLLAGIAR